MDVHLTGDAARKAGRPYNRFVTVVLLLTLAVTVLCWLAFNYSVDRLILLVVGLSAVGFCGFVAIFDALAFSYSSIGDTAEFSLRRASGLRWVAAGASAIVGICFVVMSTSLGIGTAIRPAGQMAVTIWELGKAVGELAVTLGFVALAVVALLRRGDRGVGLVLVGLIGLAVVVNGVCYLIAPRWVEGAWREYWSPFREVWQAVT